MFPIWSLWGQRQSDQSGMGRGQRLRQALAEMETEMEARTEGHRETEWKKSI